MPKISVGATDYEFVRWEGDVVIPGEQIEETDTLPGIGGIALKALGSRGRQFQMVGVVDALDDAAVTTLRNALALTKGQKATLHDNAFPTANQFTVAIMYVQVSWAPAAGVVGGLVTPGLATRMVRAAFDLIHIGV